MACPRFSVCCSVPLHVFIFTPLGRASIVACVSLEAPVEVAGSPRATLSVIAATSISCGYLRFVLFLSAVWDKLSECELTQNVLVFILSHLDSSASHSESCVRGANT